MIECTRTYFVENAYISFLQVDECVVVRRRKYESRFIMFILTRDESRSDARVFKSSREQLFRLFSSLLADSSPEVGHLSSFTVLSASLTQFTTLMLIYSVDFYLLYYTR